MQNENMQRRSRIIGLAPVIAIAVVIGFLAFFNAGGPVYNPPYAAFILTLIFVLVIDIAVAFVSARAYLRSGSLNIVLLGAAILITGMATMFAIWMLDPNVPTVPHSQPGDHPEQYKHPDRRHLFAAERHNHFIRNWLRSSGLVARPSWSRPSQRRLPCSFVVSASWPFLTSFRTF